MKFTPSTKSETDGLTRGHLVVLHDFYTGDVIWARIRRRFGGDRFYGVVEGTDEGIDFRAENVRGIYWFEGIPNLNELNSRE